MFSAPVLDQNMPECLQRPPITVLQPASTGLALVIPTRWLEALADGPLAAALALPEMLRTLGVALAALGNGIRDAAKDQGHCTPTCVPWQEAFRSALETLSVLFAGKEIPNAGVLEDEVLAAALR